jgi:hypothetical protein
MKAGDDPDFIRAKRTMEALPRPVLRVALRLAAWIAGEHAKSIRLLGITASPFGSAMVTSVGMLGLPIGFAPIAWMYRVPLLVLIGEIAQEQRVLPAVPIRHWVGVFGTGILHRPRMLSR